MSVKTLYILFTISTACIAYVRNKKEFQFSHDTYMKNSSMRKGLQTQKGRSKAIQAQLQVEKVSRPESKRG